MPVPVSLPLIAALLLNNIVVAQHIGLRRVASLREAGGVAAVTALALLVTALLAWPLRVYLLQPLHIAFLSTFIAPMLLAVAVQPSERLLRARWPHWFPAHGDHRLLAISNGIILWLVLLQAATGGFLARLGAIVVLAAGAALLQIAFQALRQRLAQSDAPAIWQGPALEMLGAGLIVLALCGVVGVGA